MELVFLFIIITTLAIYGLGKWSVSKTDYVRCVEAGSTSHVSPSEIHRLCRREKHIVVLGKDGKPIDTKLYQRVVVKGNCLKPLGIEDDAQLLVRKFNNDSNVRIPVDTRSPIPVISVQSDGDLQYRRQS